MSTNQILKRHDKSMWGGAVEIGGIVKKWSNFSNNLLRALYLKEANLLKILVPEVGIKPTWGGSPAGF
jgi:hypothetical protein